MAPSTTLRTRTVLRRISRALKEFAAEQGWQPGEYQVFFRVLEDWGRISILFIVKEYAGLSEKEMWVRVWDFLQESQAGRRYWVFRGSVECDRKISGRARRNVLHSRRIC